MKKTVPLTIITFIIPFFLNAQSGKVFDDLSLKSRILDMDRKFAIYLPPDYESSGRSYPVLYLLHGAGDDQTGWIQKGEVQLIAAKAIRSGKATAMIIVMPDASERRRGYYNDINGKFRYEDFFFEEFIPYIEKTYKVRSDKSYRAIAGLSMGGGGTLIYALHRPDMFSSACPLSASIRRIPNISAADSSGAAHSREQVDRYTENHDAIYLAKNMPDDQKTQVRWFIDCGDDDFLYEGNSLLHIAMRKKEIPHEFRIRDGNHTWTYWRSALPEVLAFVSQSFHRY
jgi:enterochelin esterase-like enzyme